MFHIYSIHSIYGCLPTLSIEPTCIAFCCLLQENNKAVMDAAPTATQNLAAVVFSGAVFNIGKVSVHGTTNRIT